MLKAGNLMTRKPDCCLPSDTLGRALRLMERHNHGIVPVIKDQHDLALVGIVTDRDIALYLSLEDKRPSEGKIADCMSHKLVTASPDDTPDELLRKMGHHHLRRLPIVDDSDKIVGIVSLADVARHPSGSHELRDMLERAVEQISAAPAAARR